MNASPPSKARPARGRGAKRRIRLPAVRTDWSQLDAGNLEHPALYINRELSWLEFNQRVLNQALDPAHPLLERIKFLAIVASQPAATPSASATTEPRSTEPAWTIRVAIVTARRTVQAR